VHTYPQGAIQVAHLNNLAIYDPASQGAIASINYSYDLRHYDPPSNQAVAYSLLILQNGIYYATSVDNIFTDSWQQFPHTNVTASMFTRLSKKGPMNPDFSCSGKKIQFGFRSGNSNPNPTNTFSTRTSGIDNWSVTVNSAPIPSAADPGFTLTATLPANSPTYQLKATYPALPANVGASFWWQVEEIPVTGAPIGLAPPNPQQWWSLSVPDKNEFWGYNGTPNLASGAPNTLPVGEFNQGKKYRITRGVWSTCSPWRASSKTVFMCNGCRTTEIKDVTSTQAAPVNSVQ
jgi:hypothetical protein